MAKLLVVHPDRTTRRVLEAYAALHHHVHAVDDIVQAEKALAKHPPDLVVVGLEAKKREALELLRFIKRMGLTIPSVVLAGPGTGLHQPLAMRLGAVAFLEDPIERDAFNQAISKALQSSQEARGEPPPITEQEQAANLTELERRLNRHMQCFAGKNQVYLQSLIVGNMRTTKPRVALKCPLRKQYGMSPNVYYEYIRDVCCGNPAVCPAYQEFRARNSA